MGKRRLITGVLLGALTGGAIALLDEETREYAKDKVSALKNDSTYYLKHPAEAIESLKATVEQFNRTVSSGAENAINAIEQVEDTINKFTNKN
ncbi:hypothetical protein GCM10010978_25770 [Compostibacillus humi]|uniref:YtxH domain-containing protein n=1 Tax=Compostibacillus humi TaxID=1245525 RepID=A0A8J2X9T2_9BACI|nr:YtxH domain-containing protein [Compostibacillus humi]GFZ84286.1 hypothetical protein GCM10010978_25770 [Compostibacillus humi]HLT54768.1 YtxH domain-containing protein [Bacillota bacterium]